MNSLSKNCCEEGTDAKKNNAVKIIDTHQHFWNLERFAYSWCESDPTLGHSFLMDNYLEATRDSHVSRCVHVEADVDEPDMLGETKYILALAEADNPLEGVVACARPERQDFPSYLEQISEHPKLKGIRRVLHTQPDELAQGSLFAANVRRLASYNLSFDICVKAYQLPVAINLVKGCPEVSFILDHCGVPLVKEKQLDPWRAHLREISRLPNVVCKISGLVAYADRARWTPEDLRPYVEHTIECFGWERVMFGSDWPVCTLAASFKQWADALLYLTQDAGDENRRKLFAGNATRVYRLN